MRPFKTTAQKWHTDRKKRKKGKKDIMIYRQKIRVLRNNWKSIIKIFWPIKLNDLWSKKISRARPKMIVWSGTTFILLKMILFLGILVDLKEYCQILTVRKYHTKYPHNYTDTVIRKFVFCNHPTFLLCSNFHFSFFLNQIFRFSIFQYFSYLMLLKISLEASVSVIYGGIASRWKVPQGFHLLNLSDSDFKISQNRNVYFLFFTV